MPVPAGSTPYTPTTGPLIYDPVLSRVRLNLTGLTVTDTFTRSVSSGWGTADSGHAWSNTGGATSDYSATGSVGRQAHTATNTLHHNLTDVGSPDAEILADVTIAVGSATGAAITAWAALRAADTLNYYTARLDLGPGSGMSLILTKRVAGSLSANLASASVGTHSAGATWRIRFSAIGSTLQAKAWLTSGTEPATWQVEATDTALTAGTLAGPLSRLEAGNSNTLPVNIDWDNVTITPTITVERSTDQVRWTTVRGGVVVPSNGEIRVDDYEFSPDVANYYRAAGYVGSIVPVLDSVWAKVIARPFLNRKITVRDFGEATRPGRGGVFDIVGRSLPIGVTEVRGSRRWPLLIRAADAQEAAELDLLTASGDIVLIQTPTTGRLSAVPSGYVMLGDTGEAVLPTARLDIRVLSWQCTEVAPPGPDVVGSTATWQTVLNTYATWADVMAAHPTWADLMELVGSPEDVIVE